MKHWLPLFLLCLMSGADAMAAEFPFYLGTHTHHSPDSKGIYAGALDAATGRLGPLTLAAEAKSPGFLALSPDGKFLYATVEEGGGAVRAFRVEPGGKLTALDEQPSGDGPCHVAVDRSGRNVLVAHYGGGSIACWHTRPDGSLGERTALVRFTGSGPDAKRQTKPYAHSIYTDESNRFVYACDLGTDQVWIFRLDAAQGTLTPADPSTAKTPPGAGPRHLAFHPNGRFVYANNELGLSVTAFARDPDSGALTALQTLSCLPEGASGAGCTAAEIVCHPSGKWLYVSNRGRDVILVYAIGADGKLVWIEEAPAGVKTPRSFGMDPSGRWLIAAGQDDGKINVLKIDEASGKLTVAGESASVGAPVCVLFTAPQ